VRNSLDYYFFLTFSLILALVAIRVLPMAHTYSRPTDNRCVRRPSHLICTKSQNCDRLGFVAGQRPHHRSHPTLPLYSLPRPPRLTAYQPMRRRLAVRCLTSAPLPSATLLASVAPCLCPSTSGALGEPDSRPSRPCCCQHQESLQHRLDRTRGLIGLLRLQNYLSQTTKASLDGARA
jgi:hypothetical protein